MQCKCDKEMIKIDGYISSMGGHNSLWCPKCGRYCKLDANGTMEWREPSVLKALLEMGIHKGII
jgi:hypothetical protein